MTDTLQNVVLKSHIEWANEQEKWIDATWVDWDNCSPNLRVKLRKAGYSPATFLCFDGVHPVKK